MAAVLRSAWFFWGGFWGLELGFRVFGCFLGFRVSGFKFSSLLRVLCGFWALGLEGLGFESFNPRPPQVGEAPGQ